MWAPTSSFSHCPVLLNPHLSFVYHKLKFCCPLSKYFLKINHALRSRETIRNKTHSISALMGLKFEVLIREINIEQVMYDSCNPLDCSLSGSSVHDDSSGKNTGVGSHFPLQGIFLTQESNPGLLHCRQIFYWMIYEGSSFIHSVSKFFLNKPVSHMRTVFSELSPVFNFPLSTLC